LGRAGSVTTSVTAASPSHEPQPHRGGLESLVDRGEQVGAEGVEVSLVLGASTVQRRACSAHARAAPINVAGRRCPAKIALPKVAMNVATANVSESAGTATLTVNLSASSTYTVTVDYLSSNGTAKSGSDYGAVGGSVVFVPGQTSKTINISIANDGTDEPNETFTVTLSNPGNAVLGTPASTTVTITDDDAPPTVAWQSAGFSDAEDAGPALVTVLLSAASAFTVTVNYATSNDTATAPGDYTASSGTLTFASGETSKQVNVTTSTPPRAKALR